MQNYVADGDVISVTAPATVSSGDGVTVGQIFGVVVADASSGATVQLKTKGVFDLAKTSAQAWSVGDGIYWDEGNSVATNVDSGILIGVAIAAAANPSATGRVRLNGHLQAAIASY